MLRSQHLLAVAGQHVKQITFALQDYTVSAQHQYSDIYTMALSTALVPLFMAVWVTIFVSSLLLYFQCLCLAFNYLWQDFSSLSHFSSRDSNQCSFDWVVTFLCDTRLLSSLHSFPFTPIEGFLLHVGIIANQVTLNMTLKQHLPIKHGS